MAMGILHTIDTILTVVEDHQEVGFLVFYYSGLLTEIYMTSGYEFLSF